jgi:hypothetical protein
MIGVMRTMRLGLVWLGELVTGVKAGLVAK